MYTVDPQLRAPVDLNRLFAARSREDVAALIASIPNPLWRPYGDVEGNYALINATADSLDAVIEKLINGMDALIEQQALLRRRTDLPTPRDAAQEFFGVPNGHMEYMNNKEQRDALERLLSVTLRQGDADDRPTVVVKDAGVGQHPDDFPGTLVSLNRNNKRDKFWLLGAYGWGGAAALAYCDYMILISRRDPRLLEGRPDRVGFTIVRYNDLALERTSKTGVYEYLVIPDERDINGKVPSFDARELPAHLREWSGTICGLVNYDIGRDTGRAAAFLGQKSLLNICNAAAFDPVLPFMVREERHKYARHNPKNAEGVPVNGNAARLAWLAAKGKAKRESLAELLDGSDIDKEGREVGVEQDDYYDARLTTGGRVRVRWWVMGHSKKDKKDWEPARNYVSRDQAVTLVHNGQRHAAWGRQMFEDWGFTALAKSLIVEVDADGLDWTDKRKLFATTRDQLRRTDTAQDLRLQVKKALQQSDELRKDERLRRERALGHESKEQAARIQKMLEDAIAGYKDGNIITFRQILSSNSDLPVYDNQPLAEPESTETDTHDTKDTPPPLQYEGAPTFIHVLNAPVHVPAGKGRAIIRLHIDAPDDYFERSGGGELLPLMTRGKDVFRLDGFSSLRNGFMRCTVSAPGAQPGDKGRVIFTVTRPDDVMPISEDAELIADEPAQQRVKSAGKAPGKEQGPPVRWCRREQWDALGFDEMTVAKLVKDPADPELITIWVNWDFKALNDKLIRERKLDEDMVSNYKERFVAAMGFLVWLQHKSDVEINNEELKRAAEVHLFSVFVDARMVLRH